MGMWGRGISVYADDFRFPGFHGSVVAFLLSGALCRLESVCLFLCVYTVQGVVHLLVYSCSFCVCLFFSVVPRAFLCLLVFLVCLCSAVFD